MVDFQGSRVTSDGGFVLVRETDERLGPGDFIAEHLSDSRFAENTRLPPADLFRQSVYGRVAGYEDVDDAERLAQDPAFRLIGSETVCDRGAVLTYRLQTFETEMLAEEENFARLARINRQLISKLETRDAAPWVVPDMGSTEIPGDGGPVDQEGQAGAVLLTDTGEKPFNAAAVRGDGGKDCSLTRGDMADGGCW